MTEIIKLDNRKGFVEDIRHTLNCLRTSQEQYFRLRRVMREKGNKNAIGDIFKFLDGRGMPRA